MNRRLATNTVQVNGPGRQEELEGRQYFVRPAVIMVEGVHCGEYTDENGNPLGCLYHPPEALAPTAQLWDNMPVVVNHPRASDTNLLQTARMPAVLEEQGVGRLFNTVWDAEAKKLRTEIWAEMARLQRISPEGYNLMAGNAAMEVSTGLFFNTVVLGRGTWQGEAYEGTVTGIIPDHLALLTGLRGACSIEDGCGVGANKSTDETRSDVTKVPKGTEPTADGKMRSLVRSALSVAAGAIGLELNEAGFTEKIGKIARAVDRLDGNGWIHFLREVYEDRVVYVARTQDPSSDSGEKIYQRPYTMDDNGNVVLGLPVVEVREERAFVPVGNEDPAPTVATKPITEKERAMQNKCQLIAGLIANTATRFTEKNRDWLERQDEATLELMSPAANEDPPTPAEPAATPATPAAPAAAVAEPAPAAAASPAPAPAATPAPETAPAGNEDEQVAKFLASAPPTVRAILNRGLASHKQECQELVKLIMANGANKFTEAQLNTKPLEELESLAALAGIERDYTGRLGSEVPPAPGANETADPAPKVFPTAK